MRFATIFFTVLSTTLFAVNGQSMLDAYSRTSQVGYGDFGDGTPDLKLGTTVRQSTSTVRADALSPFCNVKRTRDPGPYEPKNCAAWAEHEVDMVLMLLDLISEKVPTDIAVEFYKEVACLSRSNLFYDNKKKSLQVCFSRDYSKVVGELLAKYVRPVFAELDLEAADENVINLSSRTLNMNNITAIGRQEVSVSEAIAAAKQSGTADCCRDCASSRYFVFYALNMCVNKPTGSHCCHMVCQSLERVKIGMDSSTSYCCPGLYPQRCVM